MPRILSSQVLRFIGSVAVIVLLAAHPAAAAQPAPQSQAQLEDRVKQLETRLNEAEKKAASAAMEKDYITRTQKQYETYYEKAFNSQIVTVTILGLVIGLVGKFGLDRVVQHKLSEASAQLRAEFTQLIEKETQALREANEARLKVLEDDFTKRITQQEQDLKTRSHHQFQFAQALSFSLDHDWDSAVECYRNALASYKIGRPRQLFEKNSGIAAVYNLFLLFEEENKDRTKFTEKAKKELAAELYNDLGEELALAAVDLDWLGPLLKERKPVPSKPVAAEPKTAEAARTNPKPPALPDDAK